MIRTLTTAGAKGLVTNRARDHLMPAGERNASGSPIVSAREHELPPIHSFPHVTSTPRPQTASPATRFDDERPQRCISCEPPLRLSAGATNSREHHCPGSGLTGIGAASGHAGGNRPSAISSSRSSTRNGSFILSNSTVMRPIGVKPIRRGPAQRKCRAHLCRRGLNSGVSFRVTLSMLPMSEPL
jgi:hypothetical protein